MQNDANDNHAFDNNGHSDVSSSQGDSDDVHSVQSFQAHSNSNYSPSHVPALHPLALGAPSTTNTTTTSRRTRRHGNNTTKSDWTIVEGFHGNSLHDPSLRQQPPSYEGFIAKRRKWPMKGWHKRYFKLESGILVYAKNAQMIARGRFHGRIDTAMTVITFQRAQGRIDIDADSCLHHLKIKDAQLFESWLDIVSRHRRHRQWLLATSSSSNTPTDNTQQTKQRPVIDSIVKSKTPVILTSVAEASSLLDTVSIGMNDTQRKLDTLRDILHQLQLPHHGAAGSAAAASSSGVASRSMRLPRQMDLRQSYHAGCDPTAALSVSSNQQQRIASPLSQSSSNPNLLKLAALESTCNVADLHSAAHTQFMTLAVDVVGDLQRFLMIINNEKQQLSNDHMHGMTLRSTQSVTEDVRMKLVQLRQDMDGVLMQLANAEYLPPTQSTLKPSVGQSIGKSRSFDNDSLAEQFYDAEDRLSAGSLSDASSSEVSDVESVENESDIDDLATNHSVSVLEANTGRRDHLPAPMPNSSDFSLFNLLRKNIGRDLSKVRLPVSLHEPLSALQRICEELEYSELLDTAASLKTALDRMVYVAAFAVSGYASTFYRGGTKPFNPVLGETYENVREDKGWKFIAEQVSHHPPVSSCHCSHDQWVWWQDLRLKNKFWGKSLEALPIGLVHLRFPHLNESYQWNKVTTCVHNLFGGKRSIEHYGDMTISSSSGVTCQLTFHRATSSWISGASSGQRFQVSGKVRTSGTAADHSGGSSGQQQQRMLFGRWNEGIYCGHDNTARCIWRPGGMPADHELYYGFTRFAIELNHLDDNLAKLLPRTDSRFRPDQRLLENGDTERAEAEKYRVEELQRKRIAQLAGGNEENWTPLWFRRVEDVSEFMGDYWRLRDEKCFGKKALPLLW